MLGQDLINVMDHVFCMKEFGKLLVSGNLSRIQCLGEPGLSVLFMPECDVHTPPCLYLWFSKLVTSSLHQTMTKECKIPGIQTQFNSIIVDFCLVGQR